MEKINIEKMQEYIGKDSLDEYRNELFNRVYMSKYYALIKEEGFTDQEIKDNVTKFNDYVNDLAKASKIKTYEDCVKYQMEQRVVLHKNQFGRIEKDYVPLEPYIEHLNYLSSFVARDFDESFYKANWMKDIDKRARNFIGIEIKNNNWVYIDGPLRSGRTYAAIALTNYKYVSKGFKIAFLNCPKRFKELTDAFFKDKADFNDMMEEYSNLEYLVLDDFGSEFKNELIRDNIVLPLLKNRLENNKLTIFTSDFSVREVTKLYSFSRNGEDIIATQMARILESKISQPFKINKISVY